MALKYITYKDREFEIAYDFTNLQSAQNTNSTNPIDSLLIILHGWGANKELMSGAFSTYFTHSLHLYIDLPGFGRSTNKAILNTFDYANIINTFLEKIYEQYPNIANLKRIFMGHSFGGKIASLLAKDYLILLSSAGILRHKPLITKIKIALAKICNFFSLDSKRLRAKDAKGLSKNMYETFKNVIKDDFSEVFKLQSAKTCIFWGIKDTATPLDSGKRIQSLITNSRLYELEGDHFFFLTNAEFIATKSLEFFNLTDEIKIKSSAKNIKKAQGISSTLHTPSTFHLKVFGRVQGVGFRKFSKKIGDSMGLYGTTQNLADGSVEIFIKALQGELETYIEALKKGNNRCIVSDIQVQKHSVDISEIFRINGIQAKIPTNYTSENLQSNDAHKISESAEISTSNQNTELNMLKNTKRRKVKLVMEKFYIL